MVEMGASYQLNNLTDGLLSWFLPAFFHNFVEWNCENVCIYGSHFFKKCTPYIKHHTCIFIEKIEEVLYMEFHGISFFVCRNKTCEPLYWGYFSWVLQWLRDLGVPLVTERTERYRAECRRFRGSDVGLFLSWVYLPSYIFCKILVYRSICLFFLFPSVFLSFYVSICWFDCQYFWLYWKL